MLNKEYIVDLLKEDDMVNKVLVTRTQFNHVVVESNFFNTFFQVLKSEGIECTSRKDTRIIDNDTVEFCYIEFIKDGEKYITEYDNNEFQENIRIFNDLQRDMSMHGSTNRLIEIFIDLLK